MEWIQMYIKSLGNMSASSYVVLLKESHGKRLVPIMVGENEAMAIQYNHFKSTAISHPSIYNVMLEILERNQLHVTQVQISEFKEGNFFCYLLCFKLYHWRISI